MKNAEAKYKVAIFIVLASLTEAAFGIYIGRIVDAINIQNKDIFFQRLLLTFGIIIFNLLFSILARSSVYQNACQKAEKLKNKVYIKELNRERHDSIDIANFTSKVDLVYTDDFLKLCSLPITVLIISHHVNDEVISLFDDVVSIGSRKEELIS